MFHPDTVKRILSNKFYIGVINFGAKHTKELTNFFSLLNYLEKSKTSRISGTSKKYKHNFTFLGLVKCAECGCAITAEVKHKCYPSARGNVDYIYYRRTKKKIDCSENYIREELLER